MDYRGGGKTRGRGGYSFGGRARISGKSAAVQLKKAAGESDSKTSAPVANVFSADGDNSTSRNQRRSVTTMITENGTEVPKRLNNKVFIDGLPYDNNKAALGSPSLEEELIRFATAWKVGKPIRLIKKDGQGFGFLVFHSPHSVDVAVRVLNGRKFLGRTLRVEVPKPKDTTPSSRDTTRDDVKSSYTRQVLLSDLAKVSQPDIIREILRDVAPQLEKRLETIKMASRNRKAFLTFVSAEDVGPAVGFLDGFIMLGRRIAATQAAAPGSLPYSRIVAGGHKTRTLDVLTSCAGGGGSNAVDRNNLAAASASVAQKKVRRDVDNDKNDGDAGGAHVVVPLGMEVERPTRQVARRGVLKEPPEAKKTSNITGVTEKYNLLDNGPAEVFVGNLGDEITEEQLRNHFSACGRILSSEIVVNKSTNLPTGIARIVFALPAYADYAQRHLHGSRLHGYVLRVDRGDEPSAPLASGPVEQDGDDVVDEDGYMEHYGVKDKAAYFKGTSFEEEEGARGGGRRPRETAGGKGRGRSGKKRRTEGGEGLGAAGHAGERDNINGGGDDDDDGDGDEEEECFRDVDAVEVLPAVSKKRRNTKKLTKKAKK